MEKIKIICLLLFVVLILVFSSCHSRRASDIKHGMRKEQVISLWGETDLISHKNLNGTSLEIWEYHFASSGSTCRVTFIQNRVATSECHQ
jgi:hypothetical protein